MPAFFRGIFPFCAYYGIEGTVRTLHGELIELLKNQSPEGLAELKRRFDALIRYVVEPILPDARDAEECVSDVYIKLWSAAPRLDPDRPLKPFVTAVARNAAVSMARKTRPEAALDESVPGEESPEAELMRRERIRALKRALNALTPGERRLIYRKYYYRQPTAQIAAELGTTERAVEGRLYRLKQRLRDMMGGEWDG